MLFLSSGGGFTFHRAYMQIPEYVIKIHFLINQTVAHDTQNSIFRKDMNIPALEVMKLWILRLNTRFWSYGQ